MIPSQPQASKRKATEDVNPLAATTGKKLKREVRTSALLQYDAVTRMHRALRRVLRINANVSDFVLFSHTRTLC